MKLNSQHKTINFTLEFEIDQKIPFLDLLIKRYEDKIKFEIIYR